MPCEICGDSACTYSFHSFEEQEEIERRKDTIRDSMKKEVLKNVKRMDREEVEGRDVVYLDDVLEEIEDSIDRA